MIVAPGVNTFCYLIRRGVVLIPGDVVVLAEMPDEMWLVTGIKSTLAFLERLRPPTDAEIYEWIS